MEQQQSLPASSLEATDARAAQGATAPRITLADIRNQIVGIVWVNGHEAALAGKRVWTDRHTPDVRERAQDARGLLTICIVTLMNGFSVVGKSAPMSRDNFDVEKGRQFAYDDAVRQIWPLMAYAALTERAKGE